MARLSDLRDKHAEETLGEVFWTAYNELKISYGLTDEDVARGSRFKANHISAWKARKFIPRADYAYHIAGVLHTTMEFMLSGTKPKYVSSADSSLLDKAKRYIPVLDGLDVMDPVCRSALTRAIVDIAAPRQTEPPTYQREALDQPIIGDGSVSISSEDSAAI